jgi:hypothetical protein
MSNKRPRGKAGVECKGSDVVHLSGESRAAGGDGEDGLIPEGMRLDVVFASWSCLWG